MDKGACRLLRQCHGCRHRRGDFDSWAQVWASAGSVRLALESMARQPESAGQIQTAMLIIAALLEGATFFSLIICILMATQSVVRSRDLSRFPCSRLHSLISVVLVRGCVLIMPMGTALRPNVDVEPTTVAVTVEDAKGHAAHAYLQPQQCPTNGSTSSALVNERKVIRMVQQKPVNILDLSAGAGHLDAWWFSGCSSGSSRKSAWGPMLEGLHKREETIQGALTDAQKARDEAKGVRDEVKRRLDQIGEEIRNLMDDARRKAESLTADMTAKARQEIQADRDRLLREIGLEKDKALKELLDQTAHLATLVSAKTIRRQLSPEDHRRLIDEALVELRKAGAANGAVRV